jgi:hypothetical protein
LKDLNEITVENLISSPRSRELEFLEDDPAKNTKSLALKSSQKSSKALKAKVMESEEEVIKGELDQDSEDEFMALLTRRFQQWAGKSKRFSSKKGSLKSSSSKEKMDGKKGCFNSAKSLVILLLIVQCFNPSKKERRAAPKKKVSRTSS